MTSPRAESDLLIALASRRVSALTPDFPVRSLPAKSSKLIWTEGETLFILSPFYKKDTPLRSITFPRKRVPLFLDVVSMMRPMMRWDRELLSFILVAAVCLPLIACRKLFSSPPLDSASRTRAPAHIKMEKVRVKVKYEKSKEMWKSGVTWDPNGPTPVPFYFQFVCVWRIQRVGRRCGLGAGIEQIN